MDFYQICTLVAVVAFVILVVYAVKAFIRITCAAEAVEYLAMTTAEKVDKTESTFALLDNISTFLDSGFYKAAKFGMDLMRHFRKEK